MPKRILVLFSVTFIYAELNQLPRPAAPPPAGIGSPSSFRSSSTPSFKRFPWKNQATPPVAQSKPLTNQSPMSGHTGQPRANQPPSFTPSPASAPSFSPSPMSQPASVPFRSTTFTQGFRPGPMAGATAEQPAKSDVKVITISPAKKAGKKIKDRSE